MRAICAAPEWYPEVMGKRHSGGSRTAGAVVLAFNVAGAAAAHAQNAESSAANASLVRPPAPWHPYMQYGVALTVEGIVSAGPACSTPTSTSPAVAAKLAAAGCILGSGGGIAIRVGWRPAEGTYLGGAYEFSKQDPHNLYRLGILQQARFEVRHYFDFGMRTRPFAIVGGGLAAYGEEWSIATWGFAAAIGGGLEFEVSSIATLGVGLVYRPVYLRSWVDSSTIPHQGGVAHLFGLEIALEAEDRR
jgi:hypothetical protein